MIDPHSTPPEAIFGRIREIMHGPPITIMDEPLRHELLTLVIHLHDHHPDMHRVAAAYMGDFPDHFENTLLDVHSLDELRRAHALLPRGGVHLAIASAPLLPNRMRTLTTSPEVSCLQSFDRNLWNSTGSRNRMRILSNPYLTGIRTLAFHGLTLDARVTRAIAENDALRHLTSIYLGVVSIDPKAAAALALLDPIRPITLDVRYLHDDLELEAILDVLDGPLGSRTRTLELTHVVATQALERFARFESVGSLETLTLHEVTLAPRSMAALARARFAGTLRSLRLIQSTLTAENVAELTRARGTWRLRELVLGNPDVAPVLEPMLGWDGLAHLDALRVDDENLDAASTREILEFASSVGLKTLRLHINATNVASAALYDGAHTLELLELVHHDLHEDDLERLRGCAWVRRTRTRMRRHSVSAWDELHTASR